MKQSTMIIIGLTGSMAMGKSTATTMLQEMDGVAVLCSDDVVRGLYKRRDVIDLIKTGIKLPFLSSEVPEHSSSTRTGRG